MAKSKQETKMSIGEAIDTLHKIREDRRRLAEEDKALAASAATVEALCLDMLKAQGLEKATGSLASARVSTTVVGNVLDWSSFYKLVKTMPHLLQQRVSDPAFRELLEQKGEAYLKKFGIEPFDKVRLNLRNL